jgi:chromate transporter
MRANTRGRLSEVVVFFLRLGFTAFGGPAAHIAMMREELVRRRKWLSDEQFLDLLGEVNLIPGPNSTELAISLGYLRAGWPGLLAAGICFIGPAMLIVLTLAWAYVTFGSAPEASWLLYGIKPVVIAIVVQALIGLGRTALRGLLPVLFALALLILYLRGNQRACAPVRRGRAVRGAAMASSAARSRTKQRGGNQPSVRAALAWFAERGTQRREVGARRNARR